MSRRRKHRPIVSGNGQALDGPRAPAGGFRYGGRTYRENEFIPLDVASKAMKFARKLPDGVPHLDPSRDFPQAPPNFGRPVMPHILSYQGLFTTISKAYRDNDEALRHVRHNAIVMRNDCSVMESLEARMRATALLGWHIEPEDQTSHDEKELCRALTKLVERTWRFTMYRYCLMEAIWFGRCANQNLWDFDHSQGQRNLVIPHWLPVNGDKLVFRYDDGFYKYDPNQIGIKMIGHYKDHDVIAGGRHIEQSTDGMCYFFEPWERSMMTLHQHIVEDAAFEDPLGAGAIKGVGIRSRIYWTWFQMTETLAMLMEFMQRSGRGIWIYWYPTGDANAEAKMREVAERNTDTNIILMPRTPGDPSMDAYGIERVDIQASGVEQLRNLVTELFAARIKRYIIGQKLTSEVGSTGMGSGVADLQYETMLDIIRFDAANLEQTLTDELVRVYKEYNFPAARNYRPRFRIDTTGANTSEEMDAIYRAWSMGAKIKSLDLYQTIGFSAPAEGEDFLQNPQFAMQPGLGEGQEPGQQAAGNQVQGATLPAQESEDENPVQEGDSAEDMFGQLTPPHRRQGAQALKFAASSFGGMAGTMGPPPGVGQTKTVNGVQYTLNQNHRWTRVPGQGGAPSGQSNPSHPGGPSGASATGGGMGGAGKAPHGLNPVGHLGAKLGEQASTHLEPGDSTAALKAMTTGSYSVRAPQPGKSEPPQSKSLNPKPPAGRTPPKPEATPEAPQDGKKFVSDKVLGAPKELQALIKGFHSSPEFGGTQPTLTKSLSPQEGSALYQWMQQNAGKPTAAGVVADLGGGAYGYTGAAGAVVLTKKGDGFLAGYTHDTNVVKRAMQAPQAKAPQPTGTPGVIGPEEVEGLKQKAAAAPESPGMNRVRMNLDALDAAHQAAIGADDPKTRRQAITTAQVISENLSHDPHFKALMGEGSAPTRLYGGSERAPAVEQPATETEPQNTTEPPTTPEGEPVIATARQPPGRQPHEMTRDEFAETQAATRHKAHIKQALAEGKPVSPEVLADYPELTKGGTQGDLLPAPAADPALAQRIEPNLAGKPAPAQPPNNPDETPGEIDQGGDTPPAAAPVVFPARKPPKPVTTRQKPEHIKSLIGPKLKTAGVPDTLEHRAMLEEGIHRGDIANHDQLGRVVTKAGKIHQRLLEKARAAGHIAQNDTGDEFFRPALREALRQKANRAARPESHDLIQEAAEKHQISPEHLQQAMDELSAEQAQKDPREQAKSTARTAMGLTAGDIQRFENQGLDYTADHPKLKGFDAKARTLATEHPELGLGQGYSGGEGADQTDYSRAVWDLLKEGAGKKKSRLNPKLVEEAAKRVKAAHVSPEEQGRSDSIPFAKGFGGKPFDERKHPRGQPENKGEFGPGAGGTAPDEPFTLKNAPAKPKPADFTPAEKREQKPLFSGLNALPGQQDLFATDGSLPDLEPGHVEPDDSGLASPEVFPTDEDLFAQQVALELEQEGAFDDLDDTDSMAPDPDNPTSVPPAPEKPAKGMLFQKQDDDDSGVIS